jgi:anti-sigma B factor antagonist
MSVDEQLRIATRRGSDRLILELVGDLDMASETLLRDALAQAEWEGMSTVVLDLRGVRFVDSAGLKAIFRARKAVRERGQQFAVTPGSAQVQRLLSLTHLDEHLRTIDSPDALLT